MLQIQNICKRFVTGDLTQTALNGVFLNLRDSEFVAVLGPSGSGKTTLLNIIGGLDRYDSGDLIINGTSTRMYNDRDWDSYRNHTIGFVFQSYNLIPHQSILANVELALTISGISRKERKARAKEALEKVGLGDQLHKKPNQMSGGQMQRVAIARALVNNPDILLADEPTGALDTETSIQVMELLKEVAKDRLVVMVTHNPELAEEYANRIVKLRDGKIIADSNPYVVDPAAMEAPVHKNMGKASMSFGTALSLSFNNLRTKKGRTLLTAFAGSIGIIGIALILSLSNGVNTYINNIQKSTMTSYPIIIEDEAIDMSAMFDIESLEDSLTDDSHELDAVYSDVSDLELSSSMTSSISTNNLTAFKKYLENKDSEIHQHIGANGIVYSYATKFSVFTYDPDKSLVNTDGSTLHGTPSISNNDGSFSASITLSNGFSEITPGANNQLISNAVTDYYDVVHGEWPDAYDEVVLVVNSYNEINAYDLYQLGILPTKEYQDIMNKMEKGEKLDFEVSKWTYEDICKKEFYMIPACDFFIKNSNNTYNYVAKNNSEVKKLMKDAVKLKVSGIVRPKEEAKGISIDTTLGYTKALTDYIIEKTNSSEVVKAQLANPNINVVNGLEFKPADDAAKIADAKKYIANMGITDKANLFKSMMSSMGSYSPDMAEQMAGLSETEMASMMDSYLANPEDELLLNIYDMYISTGTYDDLMDAFGVVSFDTPSSISIYADTFEAKDAISECIDRYNDGVAEEDRITYTDAVALLMSSITTIINVISYVLIAFVAVSLVVSSIMIGIITYISVLERTKEIGILRAIGASKSNISQVFNAETFIIGLCSGVIGILITLVILIPTNLIIHAVAGTSEVSAILPLGGAVILIGLSVGLTLIGGLIPSGKAAKKDPVAALRTE